jgi:hypothetical protein
VAAEKRLSDPAVLSAQVKRMLRDSRVRALAVEFGTQWLEVRNFDEKRDKNEALFPMFDEPLRKAMYEESIFFFQDLFQSDRPVREILDADYTYLNETLARHYGVPDIKGAQWRRVDGVKKYGRGGILGLSSVQAERSGASRTSPILRGIWVVEALLGEKLPKPPANVPKLPEQETGDDGLTMRQRVENHTKLAECAVCHQRFDHFGFALERYDPIGRLRDKDMGGKAIETKVHLKGGTEFDGIDGLRQYLLSQRKDEFVRNFCKKLLGYSLGRSVTLSDRPLLDAMVAGVKSNDGPISETVLKIVQSEQFRYIRGTEMVGEE